MNEPMVYGSYIHSPFIVNGYNHDHYTIDRDQLAIFRLNPRFLKIFNGWLRDVTSASSFADVIGYGYGDSYNASYSSGVRPAFAIKAT